MNSRRVICLQAGVMFCQPSHNNMPVVRERPRLTHGGATIASSNANYYWQDDNMQETILNKLAMSGNIRTVCGAFLICTEMCGSGPRTGTRLLIPPVTRWLIPLDRHRARYGSSGWFLELRRVGLRSAFRGNKHRSQRLNPLASVLVSKKPVMKKRGKSWPARWWLMGPNEPSGGLGLAVYWNCWKDPHRRKRMF